MGGLLPSGTMNIYRGTFQLNNGDTNSLTVNSASLFILFNPSDHNPLVAILPAPWNNTISAMFDNGLFSLNKEVEGKVCVIKESSTIMILNKLSGKQKFSYIIISLISV